jgi:hypothetical protein
MAFWSKRASPGPVFSKKDLKNEWKQTRKYRLKGQQKLVFANQ